MMETQTEQETKHDYSFEEDDRPKIPRDDGFKTCQSSVPTPRMKRHLRMTAARNSILSGGKPFREVGSSGKKFNSRKKLNKSGKLNETTLNSNDTFIRHERDIFDRDSLEYVSNKRAQARRRESQDLSPLSEPDQGSQEADNQPKARLSPLRAHQELSPIGTHLELAQLQSHQRMSTPLPQHKIPSPKKTKVVPTSKVRQLTKQQPYKVPFLKPRTQRKVEPLSRARPPTTMTPAIGGVTRVISTPRNLLQNNPMSAAQPKMSAIRPRANTFRKPNNLPPATSPRTRMTRANSFKSTAELEREYFSSLRSRF